MTRKNKLEPAKQPKKKLGRVVEVLDYENFNWLHSGRTPEEKKRDREVLKQFQETLERLRLEEEMQRKANQASALEGRTQRTS